MQSPFEGSLVRLRAREPADAPFFHRVLNDPEITQYILMRYPISLGEERKYLESLPAQNWERTAFSIDTLAGELIGSCALRGGNPEDRCATLGIWIGEKRHWNSGYGTDTMRVLCRFGFDHMNLHRIELEVFADNPRALRVYEKLGFRTEGCRRDADYRYSCYRDIVVMGLLREEFVEGRSRHHSPSPARPGEGAGG